MKNIVFCADGTWNGTDKDDDGDGQPDVTNVAWLFTMLSGSTTPETLRLVDEKEKALPDGALVGQVAKYLHGVGDSRNPIEKVLGGVFGSGLIARIVRGYTFISRHYRPGDRICIVGFSRGAYTARALAGLIASMSLLKPSEDREASYRKGIAAWAEYRRKAGAASGFFKGSFLDAVETFRAGSVTPDDFVPAVDVEAVAVWDTVGAYGVPIYDPLHADRLDLFKFADTALSKRVKHGFHALSIDEERLDFIPTLWDPRDGVEQVWFAGAHADVGGGYPKPKLALIPLRWMVDKLRNVGVLFEGNADAVADAFEVVHTPYDEHPFKGFPHAPRKLPDGALFHRSVQAFLDQGVIEYEPKCLAGILKNRKLPPDRIAP